MSTDTLTLTPIGLRRESEIPVKRVRVAAAVEFDAWVIDYSRWEDTEGYALDAESLAARVGSEIADAIEYHAGHLLDTDPGDGLVVLVRGGEGQVATVTDVELTDLSDAEHGAPEQGVMDAISHTRAWMS